MLEEAEARERVLAGIELGPVVWLPVPLAGDLAVARDIQGVIDHPDFDNSSMDGYAVVAAETKIGSRLNILPETQPAGVERHLELQPGSAIRIFTGAPIPQGADAVIMQEDVDREESFITIRDSVVPGENIRRRGGDVCAGQLLLQKGQILTPQRLALLSSQGLEEIPVFPRPMVGVITTGDELVQPGEYRMPGQIYDSNGILLQSAVQKIGGEAERVHADDNPILMRAVISRICETCDFAIIAGGVSVGERDYVKEVLTELGVKTDFWRVKVKPGKPFLFGTHPDGCAIFGLPGNPVSAFVTFHLFVAPALRKRLGQDEENPAAQSAKFLGVAEEELTNKGGRPHYLRGHVQDGKVSLSGTQQSHAVFGLSKANCLVRLAPGETISPGEQVTGILL